MAAGENGVWRRVTYLDILGYGHLGTHYAVKKYSLFNNSTFDQ